MGWNPYNHYGCGGNEKEVRKQATALKSLGLDKSGFVFVNLDCGWAASERDANGKIQPSPRLFPNGLTNLSKWIHSQGLRFGIYTDIGNKTCGGGAGILGHEDADSASYLEWKVDLVKNDDCHHADNQTKAYAATWNALVKTGRPMIHMTKASLDIDVASEFAQARRVSKDVSQSARVRGRVDLNVSRII
jgi:alpha-galactosidase